MVYYLMHFIYQVDSNFSSFIILIVDDIQIRVEKMYLYIYIAIEPVNKLTLNIYLSIE